MARNSSNLSRRNKSLKQMVQAEQEAAMRAAGAKFRERKKKDAQNKGKLVGAALQAFARREERERVAAASGPSEDGTPEEAVLDADEDDELSVPKRDIPTCKCDRGPVSHAQLLTT